MKTKLFAVSLLMVFLLGACNNGKSKKGKSGDAENDSILVTKTFYPGGGLQRINRGKKVIVDGKEQYVMHGEVLQYYKVPQNKLASKAIYKDGKRNGMYYKYYTNGKLYYQVNYVNGKMEGVKKMYFEDGKLMAEIPYKQGLIGVGTKEYTSKGTLLPPVELKVWYEKKGSAVTVYAKVLNKGKVTKRAEVFYGFLIEDKYYHKNLQPMQMGSNGIAKITLQSAPSLIVISSKVRSARNNYHFVAKRLTVK